MKVKKVMSESFRKRNFLKCRFAVLAIIAVLAIGMAGCDMGDNSIPQESDGQTTIRVANNSARTIMPNELNLSDINKYVITITNGTKTIVYGDNGEDTSAITTTGIKFGLTDGTWTVTVDAYRTDAGSGSDLKAATGSGTLTVSEEGPNTVIITLNPISLADANTLKGIFNWNIKLPEGANITTFTLGGTDVPYTVVGGVTSGTIEKTAGIYKLNIGLVNDESQTGGLQELVHIYPGLITEANYDFTGSDIDYNFADKVLIAGSLGITRTGPAGDEISYIVQAYSDAACTTAIAGAHADIEATSATNVDWHISIPVAAYTALSSKTIYLKAELNSPYYIITDNPVTTVEDIGLQGVIGVNVSIAIIKLSATPTAEVTTVKKDGAKQQAVAFTLTSTNTGTWKVYDESTGGTPLSNVTASFSAPTLTLTDSGDNLPVGTYYVSVTEQDRAESGRLALTVDSHGIDISLVGEPPIGVALSGSNTYTVNADGEYLVYNSVPANTSGNIIAAGNNVTLTLDNVTITGGTPIAVNSGSQLTLLLSGASSLIANTAGIPAPGINVPSGAGLVIDSASQAGSSIGSLNVQATCQFSQGIAVNGNISITGGTVSAAGGSEGAGIGNVDGSSGGNISVYGNAVVYAYSTGGNGNAAAIGGGRYSEAGTINIEGGVVVAITWTDSPSIGSGAGKSGGSINISGGTIIANKKIGIGCLDALTPVTISGNPVIFATQINGYNSEPDNGILANIGEGGVNPTGPSSNMATSGSVTVNSPFAIPAGAVLTVPQGWKVNDLDTGAYSGPLTIVPGIVFHPNGASGDDISIPVNKGEEYTIPGNEGFTRSGYNYIAWNTSSNDETTPGTFYAKDDKVVVNNVLDLYAVWDNYYDSYIWRSDNLPGGLAYIPTFGVGKKYKVVRDIDNVTGVIGDGTVPFTGEFNGNQHTITLNINGSVSDGGGSQYAGLFARADSGAVFKNFSLKGSVQATNANCDFLYAGAVVAYVGNAVIMNIGSEVPINVQNNGGSVFAGGIVGYMYQGSISRCYAAAYSQGSTENIITSKSITTDPNPDTGDGTDNIVGGIAGHCYTIEECWSEGSIKSTGGSTAPPDSVAESWKQAGGIAGHIGTAVKNCVSLCDPINNFNLNNSYGGITGRIYGGGGGSIVSNYGKPGAMVNGRAVNNTGTKDKVNGVNATLGQENFYTTSSNWGTSSWHFANSNTFDENNPWKWDANYGVGATKGHPRMSWEVTP